MCHRACAVWWLVEQRREPANVLSRCLVGCTIAWAIWARGARSPMRRETAVLGWRRPDGRIQRVVCGCTGGLEVKTCELRARADAELPEDAAEMSGDRAGAQEELRSDLAVAKPLRDELCDLQLLLGQLVPGVGDATTRSLATRAQLDACPFRPQSGPECLESVESRPEVFACIARSSCSAEKLTEGELGACTLEGARCLGVHVKRGLEEAFGLLLVLGEECPTVSGQCACPGCAGALLPGLVVVNPVARGRDLARTYG